MAKIQLKSDNINPFGGLFSNFKQFDRSGLRLTIDSALGKRGTRICSSGVASRTSTSTSPVKPGMTQKKNPRGDLFYWVRRIVWWVFRSKRWPLRRKMNFSNSLQWTAT